MSAHSRHPHLLPTPCTSNNDTLNGNYILHLRIHPCPMRRHHRNAEIHFHCFPPHTVAAAAPLFELHVIYSLIRGTFFPFTFDDSFVSRRINIMHSRIGRAHDDDDVLNEEHFCRNAFSIFSFLKISVLSLDMNCVAAMLMSARIDCCCRNTTQPNDVRISRHICK